MGSFIPLFISLSIDNAVSLVSFFSWSCWGVVHFLPGAMNLHFPLLRFIGLISECSQFLHLHFIDGTVSALPRVCWASSPLPAPSLRGDFLPSLYSSPPRLPGTAHLSGYSFIQQIFVTCLLCARHFSTLLPAIKIKPPTTLFLDVH